MGSKGWEYIDASSFCLKITDGTHDSPKRKEFGKPLITSKHIRGRNIDFENAYLISEEDYNKINLRSKVDQWDVLISMIGEYCGFCYIERNPVIDYAVKNVGIFKAGSKLKADWIYYYLNSPEGKNSLLSLKSGTSQPYLSLGALRSLKIKVPNSEGVMRKITHILSSLDEKIELNRQTNQTLEAIAQAIYKEWFVNFNFPTPEGKPYRDSGGEMYDSELGHIPKGWRVVEFTDELNIVYGKNLPTLNLTYEGYPVFGGNGPVGFYDKYLYDDPQVIVACRGAASGKVNQTLPKSFVTNNSLVFEIPQKSTLNFEYLKQYCLNTDFTSFVSGSAQPQLTIESLKNSYLMIPEKTILKIFSDLISPFEEMIRENDFQSKYLGKIRDTLLPKLMSDDIEV